MSRICNGLAIGTIGLLTNWSYGAVTTFTETFTVDTDTAVTWNKQNNRVSPNNFGYSNTNFTGSTAGPIGTTPTGAGELGGVFSRTQAADPIDDPLDPNDGPQLSEAVIYDYNVTVTPTQAFSFSGVVYYTSRTSVNTGMRIGFSNGQSSWIGPSNFMGILLNSGTTPQIQVYDTSGVLSENEIAPAGTGSTAVRLPTASAVGFSFSYDPNGAGGLGRMTYSTTVDVPVTLANPLGKNVNSFIADFEAGEKANLANFTRFGILNPRAVAAGTLTEYFDDITFNTDNTIPEPATISLLAGASLLALRRRRK